LSQGFLYNRISVSLRSIEFVLKEKFFFGILQRIVTKNRIIFEVIPSSFKHVDNLKYLLFLILVMVLIKFSLNPASYHDRRLIITDKILHELRNVGFAWQIEQSELKVLSSSLKIVCLGALHSFRRSTRISLVPTSCIRDSLFYAIGSQAEGLRLLILLLCYFS